MGRLLAIWTFVLGIISLLIYGVVMLLIAILGVLSGTTDLVQTLVGLVMLIGGAAIGLAVFSVVMFIFGFLAATVYNIILGVGGGIDFDFRER